MDKNLVVNLDEIKGIRLQCKECGNEVVVSPTTPPPHTDALVHKATHGRSHRVVRTATFTCS